MDTRILVSAVILMLGFFTFSGTLIVTNHAQDLRAFLLAMGQAVGFILNFWMMHRAATKQIQTTDTVIQKTDEVKTKIDQVKDAVNGNTPPELPRVTP